VEREKGTINAGVGRDPVRRTRMTPGPGECSFAVTHYEVVRRLQQSFWQVHLGGRCASRPPDASDPRTHGVDRHPVVGDTLYGGRGTAHGSGCLAGRNVQGRAAQGGAGEAPLGRNFLHAARLEFAHPATGKLLELEAPLPEEWRLPGRLEREPTEPKARRTRRIVVNSATGVNRGAIDKMREL